MILFASRGKPLHCSQLAGLLGCPLRGFVEWAQDGEDGGSRAADTGSAVHMAARAFAKTRDLRQSVHVMREMMQKYPLADMEAAEEQFQHYARDPRNIEANYVQVEWPVELEIDPAPEDPTQETIHVIGTLDQVREENGVLSVLDIKTGKSMDGFQMLSYYAAQLAAYQLGAMKKLGRIVRKAYIIRTIDYVAGSGPVFWQASWTHLDLPLILGRLASVVARIRAGNVDVSPGSECRWCSLGGVGNCVPILRGMNEERAGRLAATGVQRPT